MAGPLVIADLCDRQGETGLIASCRGSRPHVLTCQTLGTDVRAPHARQSLPAHNSPGAQTAGPLPLSVLAVTSRGTAFSLSLSLLPASQQAQTLSIWLIYKEEPLGSTREFCWRCYTCSLKRCSGTSTAKHPSAAPPHKYDPRCRFCEPRLQRVEQATNNNAQHRDLHRDCGTLSSSHIYSSGQRQAHTAGSGRSTAQAHRQPWVSQPGGYTPSSNSEELQIFRELTREHQASYWTSSEGVRTAHTSIPTPLGWSQQKSRCPWGPDSATAAILSTSPSSPRGAATHQGILPCGHHRQCHRSPAWGPSPWEASCSLTLHTACSAPEHKSPQPSPW